MRRSLTARACLALACFTLAPSALSAQAVTFIEAPKPLQVFPRNQATNTAQVIISGTESSGTYTHAVLRSFRNKIQIGTDQEQELTYEGGTATFHFSPSITAELAMYDLEILLRDTEGETRVARFEDLLAGDVMIIQGQSNAEAFENYSAAGAGSYESPYLRSFGRNSENPSTTESNTTWLPASGKGSRNAAAAIGGWGIVMGNQIITQTGIPLAIINGAHAGQEIGFFQRHPITPESRSFNYGRLLYRMRLAGLDQNVRAVLYYQGESDGNKGAIHEAGYKSLLNGWKTDYPGIEQFYVIQVREGCGVERFNVDLRNRQRLFADTLADHSVFTSHGLDAHDGCHFLFTGGHEPLGFNLARLIMRDLYGVAADNAEAPNPRLVRLAGENLDRIRILMRNTTDTLTFSPGAQVDFRLLGTSARIISGAIVDGAIELQLSGNAEGATTLIYNGHRGAGPWVTNVNGIGLLTFSLPILSAGPAIEFSTPEDGAQATPGTPLEISATANSSIPITRMELHIGANLVATTTASDSINATFTPPESPGAYTIKVCAFDESGGSQLKTITLFVGSNRPTNQVTAGLQVWLQPGSGMTQDTAGRISRWEDLRGNGFHISQGNNSRKPVLAENAFGTTPGLRFTGTHFLESTSGMPTGSYTKVLQYRREVNSGNASLLSSSTSGSGTHWFFHANGDATAIAHGSPFVISTEPVRLGQTSIGIATYDANTNTGQIFVNGEPAGTGTSSSDNTSTSIQIGAYSGQAFFNGLIGEILIYDRVLSTREISTIVDYFTGDFRPPYQRWQAETPGALGIDEDGDGLSALLEYALGTDPLKPNASAPISLAASASDPSALISFLRPVNFLHVNYQIEITQDLQHWEPAVVTQIHTQPPDGEMSRERVTGQIDLSHLPTTDAVFFRLAVTAE